MVKFALIAAFVALDSAKIAPSVHRHLEANKLADVVLEFNSIASALESADAELESFTERAPRIAHVRSSLINNMEASQQKVVEFLSSQPEALTVRTERFHIDNTMHISGADVGLLEKLAKFESVTHIRSPVVAHLPVLKFDKGEFQAENATRAANEWGIDLIGANTVWANGNRGEGIVVGGIDTGVVYTHEALKANWRSNYGWFDPTDKSATPIDTNGHGTHAMGSSVGSRGIGVAPGATWIACRGCTTDSCPEAALTGCAQWMLCPTDATGKNPKCELAPHVINNSWGGGSGSSWYQPQVDAWQKAGIIPVFANGNAGPNCATVESPGDYKNVIGVGAVGPDDKLWTSSSRGPTPDKRIKPDVSAPGHKIRSSWHTGNSDYHTTSGTSMAAPHVTGAIALYLSANKGAKYDAVYKAFTTTVDTATLTPDNKNCGGVKDATYPNNNHGFGRINIARALGSNPSPTSAPATTATPGTTKPLPTLPSTTVAPGTSKPRPTLPPTTRAPATSKPRPTLPPVTSKPPSICGDCDGCYATEYDYCFLPSTYTEGECAKLSFETACAIAPAPVPCPTPLDVFAVYDLTPCTDPPRTTAPTKAPTPAPTNSTTPLPTNSTTPTTTSAVITTPSPSTTAASVTPTTTSAAPVTPTTTTAAPVTPTTTKATTKATTAAPVTPTTSAPVTPTTAKPSTPTTAIPGTSKPSTPTTSTPSYPTNAPKTTGATPSTSGPAYSTLKPSTTKPGNSTNSTILPTTGAVIVPPKCTQVSVEGDATYCIVGPICSGSGDRKGGSKCPVKGDVAVQDCLKTLKSYTASGKCVAPKDAVCGKVVTGVWGCKW